MDKEIVVVVVDDTERQNKILKEAKDRFHQARTYWAKHQNKATNMLKFITGDQWDEDSRQVFENSGYAAITDNVLPSFVRQITNELRKVQPEIVFNPMENTAQEKAEMLTDLVRNIQLDSKADIAYDNGSWMAAVTGIGYWRVIAEYESEKSFNQKLSIVPIEDPNSVYLDPSHRSSSGIDCNWAFICVSMSRDEYKQTYGKSALSNLDAVGWNEAKGVFLSKDEVIVAEYYYKDHQDATLYQIFNSNNGETYITTDEPDPEWVANGTLVVLQTRPTTIPVVRHCKLNQVEILEESVFPGTIIPVVAVKGDEIWVEGERKLIGAVEPAVDSQVMLNYYLTLQAQMIQMAPKAPYIGTATQFKTYEQQWADINISGQAFIPYNSDPSAPPPSRDLGEVPIQSMAVLCSEARENLKQIFGIYDASLGAQGNETSGKAILARQEQSSMSNYHFSSNRARALRHTGEILLGAIPVIYDAERTVQTVRPDGTKAVKTINTDHSTDLTVGDYVVDVDTGPSYGTKRQEALESAMELGRSYPNAMPLIADIIVSNADWAGAKEIAARLRAAVPQQILEATGDINEADAKTLVPQLKMAIEQAQENLKALNAHAQQIELELKNAKEELHLQKLDRTLEVAKAEQDFTIKSKQIELDTEQTHLEAELAIAKLALEKEKLALQRAQLEVNAIGQAAEIAESVHNKEVEHLDRIKVVSSEDIPMGGSDLGGDISRDGI